MAAATAINCLHLYEVFLKIYHWKAEGSSSMLQTEPMGPLYTSPHDKPQSDF